VNQLTITVPTKDSPGFLRRMYRATQFQESMKAGITPELVAQMIDFIGEFVACDPPEKKLEAMWDLSENQFNELLAAAMGGGATESPLPPHSHELIATP
jgi:hypothetical protein